LNGFSVIIPMVLTGSSFSGQISRIWVGQRYDASISGTISGNNIQLNFSSPPPPAARVPLPSILNGSMNNKGEFVGTVRMLEGPCGGRSSLFTLRRLSTRAK
jgi:hypothetical protein